MIRGLLPGYRPTLSTHPRRPIPAGDTLPYLLSPIDPATTGRHPGGMDGAASRQFENGTANARQGHE
jgi:hypothetical protein